jgi:hypothetical protein
MSIDARPVGNKKGIVPRPNGDYKAGTVESGWNEGNKGSEKNSTTKIADAPTVHDREHTQASMGVGSSKSVDHGQTYPGKTTPAPQTVKDVEAKPLDRKIKDKELGVNGRLGN